MSELYATDFLALLRWKNPHNSLLLVTHFIIENFAHLLLHGHREHFKETE